LKGLPVESVIRNLVMEALGQLRESRIALVHDTDEEGITFESTVIITEMLSVPLTSLSSFK
jgi:hypothetical protein